MTTVAVVAHRKKSFGGGLHELRTELERRGVVDPLWFEVPKSKHAPKAVARALAQGADLLFVWGGDGMVQRCLDAVGEAQVPVAILPAGTANLFASNLGIPKDLPAAVQIGLSGRRRVLDTGRLDGERFAVMAGVGWDALMIRDADGSMKDRFGRAAYVWTGARHLRASSFGARVRLDGATWFEGQVTCVLVGNCGRVFGGIDVFPSAELDDGLLDVALVTAEGVMRRMRVVARAVAGDPATSSDVMVTTARKVRVDLDRAMPVELDGGARPARKRVKMRVDPSSVTVCVPSPEDGS